MASAFKVLSVPRWLSFTLSGKVPGGKCCRPPIILGTSAGPADGGGERLPDAPGVGAGGPAGVLDADGPRSLPCPQRHRPEHQASKASPTPHDLTRHVRSSGSRPPRKNSVHSSVEADST